MAMWFVHLEAVKDSARRLGVHLDRDALAWGAVCCDVDKVSKVRRDFSHLAALPRPVQPGPLLSALGLAPALEPAERSFLCGVASHLAVDDAWYSFLLAALDAHPVSGFTNDSMRALNLLLDMQARHRIQMEGLALSPSPVDGLLPFMDVRSAASLRAALRFYLAWDGDLDRAPADPAFESWVRWFAALLGREAPRLKPFLVQLDQVALMARVCDASAGAVEGLALLHPSAPPP